MPLKTEAEIAFSSLEYTSEFKRPILEALAPPTKLIAALLDVLQPFGYKLDGVELNILTRNLNEYAVIFRRSTPIVPPRSLTLGLGKVSVTAQNLGWTEAEQFILEQSAALNVVRQIGGAQVHSHQLVVGLHIQLKEKPRREVTAPLLSPLASELLDGKADFPGIILSREEASVIIDASVAYANALFVRIARKHPPEVPFEELAQTLRNDERRIFDVLGLEGDL